MSITVLVHAASYILTQHHHDAETLIMPTHRTPSRRHTAIYDWQDTDEQTDMVSWDAPHRERRRDDNPYHSDDEEYDSDRDRDPEWDEDEDHDSLGG